MFIFCILTLTSQVVILWCRETVNSGQIAAFSIHWFLLMPPLPSLIHLCQWLNPVQSDTRAGGWKQVCGILRWWNWAPQSFQLSAFKCDMLMSETQNIRL